MLTEDDIKEGDAVEMMIHLAGHSMDYPPQGYVGKVLQATANIGKYVSECYCLEGYPKGQFFKQYLNTEKHWFKLISKKETNMLDPEIYAVGTVHKHTTNNKQYRIIARNIKTNEFKSGIAMAIIDNAAPDPRPITVCQETGLYTDDGKAGLYVAPKKHKGWISVYKSSTKNAKDVECGFIWPSKEAALRAHDHDERVVAIIEVEFEEGQGL